MNRFEKVSFEQFAKDFESSVYDVREVYDNLKLPKRATVGSAGYDFFSPIDFVLRPKEGIKIPTGIRADIERDKFIAIYPRSGLGFKYKMQLWNSVGVCDADYYYSDNEGHIWVKLFNDSPDGKMITIKQGEAFCQGIITQFFTTDDDDVCEIRNGGFGSTDRN